MKTVGDLKNNVAAILTGIDLDEVPDLYGDFERAVSTFIQKADVLEASAREPIMLYDGVIDYPGPEGIFGGALIDIRQQGVERAEWQDVQKLPIKRFDRTKYRTPSGYNVTFEDNNGIFIMRISQRVAQKKITIDSMTDTSGWVLAGDATGLAKDSTVYYHQPAALRFNLTAAGASVTMTKTLTNTLNLSDYEGVGVSFLAIYMPNQQATAPIASVSLKLGSSPTDYYGITETEGFLGAFYANDFLLVAFDLAGVAATGNPDFSAVDYVQVTIAFNGTAVPNLRLGDLFISLPSANETLFYSPNVFVHSGNAPAAEITDDNDSILFRSSSYNIYVQEAAREVAKNQAGELGSGLVASIDQVLGNPGQGTGLYGHFTGDNPSEEIREVGNYYYD